MLLGIIASHTLKTVGYIKHKNVVVLIDSGNTHNFINEWVVEDTHYYVCEVQNLQMMMANEGIMKCGGLQMGDPFLKWNMFSIEMRGCDVVFGA